MAIRTARVTAALLVLMSVLAACTDAPNRSAEADRIESTVAAMPGVVDVRMRYENGVIEGTLFELDVTMPTATDRQVADVAAKINELRGDRFDAFDQRVTFKVAEWTSVNLSKDADVADFERSVNLARQLRSRVEAGELKWAGSVADGTTNVEVFDAVHPSAAMDVLLELVGERHDDLAVRAREPAEPWWTIMGNFSLADKQRMDGQFRTMPTQPTYVDVRDGRLYQLNVELVDPATGYADLAATIKAIGAGPEHPMRLLWRWRDDPARFQEPRWAGMAPVGSCDYYKGDRTSSEELVPAAADLQIRIRDDFDTCPK